jgi:hypothetical protein
MESEMRTKSPIPHSWSIANWPADVHPGTRAGGRYLVRAHRDELFSAGALARVGRELVVLGDRYGKWLQKQTANVPGYEIAANRTSNSGTKSAA